LIAISATKLTINNNSFENAEFEVLKGDYEKYLFWVLKPVQLEPDSSFHMF
jgi:hypothetical protein